jgi:AcrR family transcriptional regulator
MALVGEDGAAERLAARRAAVAERREARARVRAAGASPLRRRRGEALEAAILDAVWDQLVQAGYDGLTYERVAYRAGTSRSVVYRRWPTKRELTMAAIAHRGAETVGEVPDTGTLRGDLLALLRFGNERRSEVMVLFGTQLTAFYRETGISPAATRELWIGDRALALDQVVERAVARGEVDPSRATPRAVRVSFDLLRHDVLMNAGKVDDEVLVDIVDQVAVPLLTGRVPERWPARESLPG